MTAGRGRDIRRHAHYKFLHSARRLPAFAAGTLSNSLRRDVVSHIYTKLLRSISIFKVRVLPDTPYTAPPLRSRPAVRSLHARLLLRERAWGVAGARAAAGG